MTTIENGNIEVIKPNGDNYSVLITPLYPLDTAAALVSQVKGRAGVTLGEKRPHTLSGDAPGLVDTSEWTGTAKDGSPVVLRIWDTGA